MRLMSYDRAEYIREATAAELRASIEQSWRDGGAGVIEIDGRSVYVEATDSDGAEIAAIDCADEAWSWRGTSHYADGSTLLNVAREPMDGDWEYLASRYPHADAAVKRAFARAYTARIEERSEAREE